MPTYTYRCGECGTFEWIHPMDSSLDACPKCGSKELNKTYGAVGITFRGPGFYSTDSKSK